MTDIGACLADYGADLSTLHSFDSDSPELLWYATLLKARRNGDEALRTVKAVYESQGWPLMFLLDAEALSDENQIHRIRRLLAMRGDAPYLGVVHRNSLRVYSIALDCKTLSEARVDCEESERSSNTLLARLSNEWPNTAPSDSEGIASVVLRLLDKSITKLIDLGISVKDAILLVGLALFTRFLTDRDLLPESISQPEKIEGRFVNTANTLLAFNWLDEKFNGSLLSAPYDAIERLPQGCFHVLSEIVCRTSVDRSTVAWEEKWNNLDFAHIPIGVLSAAHELYLRKHVPSKKIRGGGYSTPSPIVELMVTASFFALQDRDMALEAQILDPAVGAGNFLLSAYRQLVAEQWRASDVRPDTKELKRILYEQLTGFDTDDVALRFTALGLHLLSVELDSDAKSLDQLHFRQLRGTVLHQVLGDEEKGQEALGSLGDQVGPEHSARYDLVVGNPPWTTEAELTDWTNVRKIVTRIASDRTAKSDAPPLPQEAIDLPFLWRAMDWAKPDGQIAFTLHARLLFQQDDGMPAVRQFMLRELDVTSIIDGTHLRNTRAWPHVSAPFCILFATNRKPGPVGGFRFVSPPIHDLLHHARYTRFDMSHAEGVSAQWLAEIPGYMKTLSRGSKLDLGILMRISSREIPTLYDFWREKIGEVGTNCLRASGSGYQSIEPSGRTRESGNGLLSTSASYLQGLPEIENSSFDRIVIDTSSLKPFSHERIYGPCSPELFAGPQVVVHKSPCPESGRIKVVVTEEGVVFDETLYGYCTAAYSDSIQLTRYLALVLGSKFTAWFALMTSGEFGVERNLIEKETLDQIPIPDFEGLSSQERQEIDVLFCGLRAGTVSWLEVDEWVFNLYGLGTRDIPVIHDTMEFNLPYTRNLLSAREIPTSSEKDLFCNYLRDRLMLWSERSGKTASVEQLQPRENSKWHGIAIQTGSLTPTDTLSNVEWEVLLRETVGTAGTEVLIDCGPGKLLVALPAQRCYWSISKAQQIAIRIVCDHRELLTDNEAA